jgi:hypothetical protein
MTFGHPAGVAVSAGRPCGRRGHGRVVSVVRLTRRRDHRSDSLGAFHERRSSSARTLSEFERDVGTLRDRLDGIERPLSKKPFDRSRPDPRRGFDHDYRPRLDRDIGHGLGR